MSVFTSSREKRLWLYCAIVLAAIYSTLSIARPLSAILRERGLIDAGFTFGLILIIIAIVVHGVKNKAGKLEAGIWIGIIAVYIIVAMRMAIPEERTHLIEYSVLAICIHEAFKERAANDSTIKFPALLSLLLTILMGVLDECIQALLPKRVFDPIDMLFNSLAASMAIIGGVAISWARQRIS